MKGKTDPSKGKIKRCALSVAAPVLLALFFCSCIAIANFPDPPTEPAALNERFIGCFCAHSTESRTDKICIEGNGDGNLATGDGAGLLPDLTATTEWVFDGDGVDERILHISVTTSTGTLHDVYAVELSEDTDSVALRKRDGTWEYPTLLSLCED